MPPKPGNRWALASSGSTTDATRMTTTSAPALLKHDTNVMLSSSDQPKPEIPCDGNGGPNARVHDSGPWPKTQRRKSNGSPIGSARRCMSSLNLPNQRLRGSDDAKDACSGD